MVTSTSYEVQVMQGGKWRIHAQFPPNGRDDAIEEAKTLESMPGLSGVKVVRDNYDDRTGLHKEHVVYKHTPPQAEVSPSESKYAHYMARAQANRMNDIDFGDGSQNGANKKSSGLGVVTKLLLMLMFSIAFAAFVVLLMNGLMPYSKIFGIKMYGTTRSNILIGMGFGSFFLSFLFSYFAFMRGETLDPLTIERKKAMAKIEQEKRRKAVEERDAKKRQEAEEKEAKKREKEDVKERTREEEEALKKQAEEELKKKAEEEAGTEETSEEPAEKAEEKEPEYSDLSPVAEAQKAVLMGFFGEAVRGLSAERKKMDNYNRFGVNLYLAGAAETLGGARNLDSESVSKILAHALGVMGLKSEHAEAFANRYEDYLLQDARYMEMFQSGRNTMSTYLGGDHEAPANLEQCLHEWNKPKAPEDPEKEVVVMFTDIVGSTAMTHEKGNLAAQEVVRAHNTVVRDALAKTGGKEIKHTGDGIMASFENVTNSLLSTQQMQMMIGMHNEQNPDIPLKVKIGINAGRVVVEEKDLYGVTVQMAARIVDKAKADQIFVSDTVYGLAKGGSWRFVKRGPYYLKGIDGPAYLQELIWDDKADIEAVKAAAEAERPQLEQLYEAASGKTLAKPEQTEQPAQAEQAPSGQDQASQTQTVPPQGNTAAPAATIQPPPQAQAQAAPAPAKTPTSAPAAKTTP